MTKKGLIIGSNSIVSEQLVNNLSKNYQIDIAYSASKCGVNSIHPNFRKLNLSDCFNSNVTYDFVIIISAYIPNGNDLNINKLFEVNIDLVEKITLKFPESKIVFCSSVSVYTSNNKIIDEKTETNPINEYGLSKLWAEKIIQRNSKSFTIFRISSLIGAKMKSNSFIPKIIDKALKDKEIIILGKGERLQNYIDVRDLAIMIEKSLDITKSEILLGVGENSYSNLQIAKMVQQVTGCEIQFNGTDDAASYNYNSSYTYTTLNHQSTVKIEDSIKELILWKRN